MMDRAGTCVWEGGGGGGGGAQFKGDEYHYPNGMEWKGRVVGPEFDLRKCVIHSIVLFDH